MKTRLLPALVGLAIGFALPTFAQQKDMVDPRIAQQRDLVGDAKALDEFGVLAAKQSEAFTNKDAAAVAALFTEDGVLVAPDGMFSGRQAIEKRYEGTFQRWPLTLFNDLRDCHLKAIDNAVWSFGEWEVLCKARLVSSLSKATFQRFIFVRMMFGKSAC
jgi:ketosteroid isomerase-like protein